MNDKSFEFAPRKGESCTEPGQIYGDHVIRCPPRGDIGDYFKEADPSEGKYIVREKDVYNPVDEIDETKLTDRDIRVLKDKIERYEKRDKRIKKWRNKLKNWG